MKFTSIWPTDTSLFVYVKTIAISLMLGFVASSGAVIKEASKFSPIEHITESSNDQPPSRKSLILGAENTQSYLTGLKGKRVGLVVNQTSVLWRPYETEIKLDAPVHLVDFLRSQDINVIVMFAPEHGIRTNQGAGEHIESEIDERTLIPIQSIYGADKTPPSEVMQKLDTIIFDIQDVGARFYTYISSMHYMMEAAAKHDVEFIVLDRPNPNGEFIDGPVLDMRFQSFVGMHPIPLLHGLTVGELALMIKGEKWIENASKLQLKVVNMLNYRKSLRYDLPIPPSPNLPNYAAVRLYPSLCFFEPTAVSIGRGTDFPFQVTGHDVVHLGDFAFTPISKPFAAPSPKLMDVPLLGIDLQNSKIVGVDLHLLIEYFAAFQQHGITFFTSPSFMDKLAGTDALRKAIENKVSEQDIRISWQEPLAHYQGMRVPYLLYPQ